MTGKMKIEIWSDVMCPFCYIGKRKFEKALDAFEHKDRVEIEWKSFQLAPDLKTEPEKKAWESLAESKGISLDDARSMTGQVAGMAAEVGLNFNYDKVVVANSFRAHQFAHFAKAHGKQNEAEELLFQSYFTQGKNIDDLDVLTALGEKLDLDTVALRDALERDTFADDVKHDIYQARQIGVRGVPFFVFDQKYAISGARETPYFAEALKKVFEERESEPPTETEVSESGDACSTDGNCA